MNTPVALFLFKREKETRRVFEMIRAAKPEVLLLVADGPRLAEESAACEATRNVVASIDWNCSVYTQYSDINLGCRARVSSGIDWIFNQVDRAIILEEDCVPHPSFFPFCEELLERYQDDRRIMSISGNFFQQSNNQFQTEDSYYASILPHIWGWATWRRAWAKYDVDMHSWPSVRSQGSLKEYFNNAGAYEYWSNVWDQYYEHKIDSWDGQWFYACAINQGICLNPTVNLVSNIGFGTDATHTKSSSAFSALPVYPARFPLRHPKTIAIDHEADAFMFRHNFGIDEKFRHRLLRPIKTAFPKLYWKSRNLIRSNFGK